MRGTSFTNDNGLVTNASNGAITTASDFINFLGMLLNKGTFEGKRVLSEKSIAEMETIQFASRSCKIYAEGSVWFKTGTGLLDR